MKRTILDLLFSTRFNRFEALILLPAVSVLLNGGHYGWAAGVFLGGMLVSLIGEGLWHLFGDIPTLEDLLGDIPA